MNGKYYGGDTKKCTRSRLSNELTLVVLHARSNIHTMIRSPKMIKDEYYKYTKIFGKYKKQL